CTLRAWESEDYCRNRLGLDAPLGRIDPEKINPVGSSLATGHPFAATGARIIATVARQLEERGGGRALVSICTAGGMGVVAIVGRCGRPSGGTWQGGRAGRLFAWAGATAPVSRPGVAGRGCRGFPG